MVTSVLFSGRSKLSSLSDRQNQYVRQRLGWFRLWRIRNTVIYHPLRLAGVHRFRLLLKESHCVGSGVLVRAFTLLFKSLLLGPVRSVLASV